MKRVMVMTDTHCGHRSGLTPPEYNGFIGRNPWADMRSVHWKWFKETVEKYKPIDILFNLGDNIDGPGYRSGASELIAVDPQDQVEMAAECIKPIEAEKIFMVRGTPYHSGADTDYEDILADKIGACSIEDQSWIDVELPDGCITFDLKHKVGGSSIPHGKGNSIAKERLWNLIHNDDHTAQPKADVFLRGHVHYYYHVEDTTYHAFTCPSLQGLGSKYGSRQCSGIVHFGFLIIDLHSREDWLKSPSYTKELYEGEFQKAKAIKA